MKKLLALLLAMVMLVSLAACTANEGSETQGTTGSTEDPADLEAAKYGGHLNFVTNSKLSNLDCAKSTGVSQYHWTNLIYENALTRDSDGTIRPNVCDFELSEDQLTLKLWVREGVTFHDGSAVEIDDVVASIQRQVHKNPAKYVAEYITNVEVKDGVATFTFKEYNEKTMGYIAGKTVLLGIMPKEIAEKYSKESGEFISTPEDAIGTGPYKVTDFETGACISVVRYEGYKAVPEGYTGMAAPKKAYMDSIDVYYASDDSTYNIALMNGDYDLRYDAGESFYEQFKTAGLKEQDMMGTNGHVLLFNTFGNGIVSGDKSDMRKAILAAIDIPEMVNHLTGIDVSKVPNSGNPVLDEAYYTDVFETADYMGADNIELSKQYQQKAGYNGEKLQIAMSTGFETEYTLICSYLTKAGINFELKPLENSAYTEFIGDPNNAWDFIYNSLTFNATPGQMSDTITKERYNSAAKDALLEKLLSYPEGTDEYVAAWKELAKQMVADCSAVILDNVTMKWWMDPDLNLEYEGANSYLWNTYWTNPSEHTK